MDRLNASFGPRNWLLAALDPEDSRRINPYLELVMLQPKQTLFYPGDFITHVYFPNDCVISPISDMEGGDGVDVAVIGREGMIGYVAALGGDTAMIRKVVHVPGSALRLDVARLRAVLRESEGLHRLLLRYIEALSAQVLQSVACNALHGVEARYCRWLLMVQDRTGKDALPLTQESLAEMLGVRRSSVGPVARTLRAAGLIRYRRGSVTVIDRAGLEDRACECYGVVRRQLKRLLPHPDT